MSIWAKKSHILRCATYVIPKFFQFFGIFRKAREYDLSEMLCGGDDVSEIRKGMPNGFIADESVYRFLRDRLTEASFRRLEHAFLELPIDHSEVTLEEIRLRADRPVCFTVGNCPAGRNICSRLYFSADELFFIFNRICDGSLYAYEESITRGYVSLMHGVRVGVCGRAAVESGRVFGVCDISALNIRIPQGDIEVSPLLLNTVRQEVRNGGGVLIFSPPAEGKTTCLRSVARFLASGGSALRVSVVDSREELSLSSLSKNANLDILSGYPKADGIRIATLFMNPEVIICDEIGSEEESRAIAEAQNCGVPLIATTHGQSLGGMLLRRGMHELHRSRAFGKYIFLKRIRGGFDFTAYTWEEAEKAFEDHRLAYNTV